MTHSGNRSSKTFKPKKNIPEGSHQYELLKHAEATLGSGNLRMAVMLPEGEDLNEWIAVNSKQEVIFFFFYRYVYFVLYKHLTVTRLYLYFILFKFANLYVFSWLAFKHSTSVMHCEWTIRERQLGFSSKDHMHTYWQTVLMLNRVYCLSCRKHVHFS